MKSRIAIALVSVLVVGCYSLQPAAMGPAPRSGDRVSMDITDLGRVYLGSAMGPEIETIEGRLLENEEGDYLVGVTAVRTLRGATQIWSGEKVRIEKQHVARLYERKFSRGRTAVLGVALAAGVVGLFGKGLGVLGPGDKPVPPDTGTIGTLVGRP